VVGVFVNSCTLTVLAAVFLAGVAFFLGEAFFLVVIQIPLGNDSGIYIKRLKPNAFVGL
jgi:hypothetical protein